jgi:transposase InsO family protein
MDDKKKKEIALFRYGLIAPVLTGNVNVHMKYFRELSQKEHEVPHCGKKNYRPETFKSWLKLYRRHGFDALMPKERADKGQSRKIHSQLQEDIKKALETVPVISGSALYRLLVCEGKIPVRGINEGTLRKFIKDNDLRQLPIPKGRKKFEKEHINELWTADCMHGPYVRYENQVRDHGREQGQKQVQVQARKHKVFLIAAIDDHSRMICARGWFWHENSISLEIVLKQAIGCFGLPKSLYCDNGSLFSSEHLQMACARLGIALIHSKPYDSPSRGKIERFFRTVRQKFLPLVDLAEMVNLEQLNHQFEQWLDKEYHKHPHSGIDNQRPIDRFMQDCKNNQVTIQRVSQVELDRAFQITRHRRVKNDSTISVEGILYDCPPEFIGKKIEIRYPSDKPGDLTLYKDDQPLVKLQKNNPHENANPPSCAIQFTKKSTQITGKESGLKNGNGNENENEEQGR